VCDDRLGRDGSGGQGRFLCRPREAHATSASDVEAQHKCRSADAQRWSKAAAPDVIWPQNHLHSQQPRTMRAPSAQLN